MADFTNLIRTDGAVSYLLIKVTPNSSRDEITGLVKTGDQEQRLAIRTRAAPEKGKANKAIISLLAKQFGLPKSDFQITSGTTSRLKTIRIGSDRETISKKLDQLISKVNID